MPAARDGRADADVLLPGVSGQQHLEGREQGHEGRHALLLAECVELLGGGRRERDGHLRTPEGLHGRARLVGGQLQRGEAGEVPVPPPQLLIEHRALQPVALPDGVVGVLEGEGRQGGRPALDEGCVERRHLTHQNAHGPAVRDDVVQVHRQHVLVRAQLQELRPGQRTGGEVEGPEHLLAQPALQLCTDGLGIQPAQVHEVQWQLCVRSDDLDRLAFVLGEGGAQRFMTARQLGEALAEGVGVERTFHAHEGGHVVGGAVGLELIDEPQALLGEGQRQRTCARHGDNRGCRPPCGSVRGIDARGEGGHGGRLEQSAQGQLHTQRGAHPGHELRGEQRVATQLEEVVVDAHTLHAQHLGPEGGELLLGGSARSDVGHGGRGRGRVRSGEGFPVHLGVGSEGQGVQPHQGGGHHVLGQPLLEVSAQRGEVERLGRGDVADQALVAGGVLAHQGHGLAHVGV